MSGMNMDARTNFFYQAAVNTPAMAAKIVGKSSQYALSYADTSGNPFDGAKTYRMNVPANAPATNF